MLRYIYFFLMVYILFLNRIFAWFNQWDIDPELNSINNGDIGYNLINIILTYIKDNIFSLLYIIWIWAFLYIWVKLIIAKWKPDEFKKAFMNLVYVIIWILIVSFSWALVRFASGIEFF